MSIETNSNNTRHLARAMRDARTKLADHEYRYRGDKWDIYNSGYKSYESWFKELGFTFEGTLGKREHPTVVDLMAPSHTLRSFFLDYQAKDMMGISVSKSDERKNSLKNLDEALGIKHITGDLIRPSTWRALEDSLEGRTADLIVERACGGLIFLPEHPAYYAYALQHIWGMLSPQDGVFVGDLFHLDRNMKRILHKWEENKDINRVDVAIKGYGMILTRHPDSPPNLLFEGIS